MLLEATKLTKIFSVGDSRLYVLKDMNFHVSPGEKVAISRTRMRKQLFIRKSPRNSVISAMKLSARIILKQLRISTESALRVCVIW